MVSLCGVSTGTPKTSEDDARKIFADAQSSFAVFSNCKVPSVMIGRYWKLLVFASVVWNGSGPFGFGPVPSPFPEIHRITFPSGVTRTSVG